jgi:hypothetical protein
VQQFSNIAQQKVGPYMELQDPQTEEAAFTGPGLARASNPARIIALRVPVRFTMDELFSLGGQSIKLLPSSYLKLL